MRAQSMNFTNRYHVNEWLCAAALTAFGCSDAAPTEPGGDNALGSTMQAWGESSCRDPWPHYVNNTVAWDAVTSPNGSYDDPACRHTYIGSKRVKNWITVSAPATDRVDTIHARYAGPVVSPSMGCNGMWVKLGFMYGPNVNPNSAFREVPIEYGKEVNGRCLPPHASANITPELFEFFFVQNTSNLPGVHVRILAQAGYGPVGQKVGIEWSWDRIADISIEDSNYHGIAWAFPLTMARCAMNQSIVGVSRAGSGKVNDVLCRLDPRVGTEYWNPVKLDFTRADDRRDTMTGDWAPGYVKGECARGSAMVGLAQTANGVIQKALCMPLGSITATDICYVENFESADSRSSLKFADWSPGAAKGQCEDGHVVKGISRTNSGHARSILCCRDSGIR